MATRERAVRQSVSLPPPVAKKVRSLAKAQRTSANRVLVNLVEAGLSAREREKQRFMELAEQLVHAKSPAEQARLKEELARLTFGS